MAGWRFTYHSQKGYTAACDAAVAGVEAADFDTVVIPGGMAPDKMRRHEKALINALER